MTHRQDKWADTAMHGYWYRRRAQDEWMDLVLPLESPVAGGSNLVSMSIDWRKCFDMVPQGMAFKVAERQGEHRCCCVACTARCAGDLLRQSMWGDNLQPRMALNKADPRVCCCLSFSLMHTLSRSMYAWAVAALRQVCTDDAGVLTKTSEDNDAALQITGRFPRVTQQKLNVVYLCLSSSSDEHHLLHSCLGKGMRVGKQVLSLSCIFGSFGVLDRFLLLLVRWWQQYHDTATSGADYSDLRNRDIWCSVCVGKHVTVSRYCRICARL